MKFADINGKTRIRLIGDFVPLERRTHFRNIADAPPCAGARCPICEEEERVKKLEALRKKENPQ